MTKWQPIETAPRDGTVFLGSYCELCPPVIYKWVGLFGHFTGQTKPFLYSATDYPQPTHWMPLPEPPKEGE